MASIIAIDQTLVAILPPKSKLKVARLVDLARDLEVSFQSLIARQERLREELGLLRSQQAQAVERAHQITNAPEAAAAAAKEFEPALAELESEITRLDKDRAKRESRRYDSAQLVAQLRSWLEGAAVRRTPLAQGLPVKLQIAEGDTPMDAVRKIRAQIEHTQKELTALRRAALPASELKAKAREYVAELSKAGTPSLHVQDAQFRVDWPPGAQMPMGSLGPGALAIICWLFPDMVTKRFDDLIDKIESHGVPAAQRGQREHTLLIKLTDLERMEECLIERFESDLPELIRRPNADPQSVLGLRFGLQVSKAS
jgi:hypothetical protein